MIKLITVLLSLSISLNAYSQCNLSKLQKRPIAKEIPMRDKVVGIRLMTRMGVSLISDINNAGSKAAKKANADLSNGVKPDFLSHIEYIKSEKSKIESYKQRKETNRLDELVYCYLDFEINSYLKLQEIIVKNSFENIISEIKKWKGAIINIEDKKIDELNAEVMSLELKYPIKVNR